MKNRFTFLFLLLLFGFPAAAQYQNIMIGNNNTPNEPSIMINPKNTSQMVAGSNIDNYYYTDDGGWTWQEGRMSSTYGVWGDPVIGVDTNGNFYFFHLSNPPYPGNWIDRIVCQKSSDGGQTWNNGTYTGLNGQKAQDKEWVAVDPANNNIYLTWTQFDEYAPVPPNPMDSSIILFSKSINGGLIWSTPQRINRVAGDCEDSDNTVEGAVPAVGPNGEIYVSWAGPAGLVFNRSLDQGATWMNANILVSDIPGGWDLGIPGIYRANGLPVTCCDLSNGPNRGTVYINWSDQRNGTDDTDIWFTKSTDGGLTWGPRRRVNDDPPGTHQFFTWMTVDQSNGYLYFVFYDRRNYSGNLTDVYMAVSKDGGETFWNFRISDDPFNPFSSVFFGDYNHISAHNGIVRPVWTRLDGGSLSIYTAIIDTIFAGREDHPVVAASLTLDQNYPNPGQADTYISFKVHRASKVSLKVMDIYGNVIAILLNDTHLQPGKYTEYFDISKYRLAPGFYYFSLDDGQKSMKKKMIIRQ